MYLIKTLYLKIKTNKVFSVGILVFFFLLILLLIRNLIQKQYLLLINVQPSGAEILVDNKYSSETNFSKKMSKGTHKIVVSKIDYKTVEKEVDLKSDTNIEIALETIKGGITQIELKKMEAVSQTFISNVNLYSNGILIAYDVNSSRLVSIIDDKINTLYKGNLAFYSYSEPLITFIDRKNINEILIFDTLTNKVIQKIDAKSIVPIMYAQMGMNNKTIFIVGKFDYKTRTSALLIADTTNFQPKEIVKIKASKIEVVSENLLLMFDKIDAIDTSKITIFDINQNKTLLSITGNNYAVSPGKKFMVIQKSDSLTIIDLNNFSQKSIPSEFSEHIVWTSDEVLLIIKAQQNKIQFFGLNSTYLTRYPIKFTNPPTNITVQEVIGISNNTLYLLDKNGFLNKITLSF
ncbi:MAG TPA: PEGA domain-containing protein [Patescibacteria group bacterium]|nr:PEGA domain-containing protein [Patescibacteria group bacterium]